MANPKGSAPWAPRGDTKTRLAEVLAVIEDGRPDWPLSQRYWLYRLMGTYGWEKFDEYNAARYRKEHGRKSPPREPYNLNGILDRGRRAGLIPWEAVVATRGMHLTPNLYEDEDALASMIDRIIDRAMGDRQAGQDQRVVLWMETEGLAPTMQRTAKEFGAPVLAGKGFDVIGRKYDFAKIVAEQGDVLILHAGDLDKSGHTVNTSLNEDLQAFIRDMGGRVEIKRIALLEEHVYAYGLAYTEVGEGLNAGNHGGGYTASIECQLEAMDISDIRQLVVKAFQDNLDMDLLQAQIDSEPELHAAARTVLMERWT